LFALVTVLFDCTLGLIYASSIPHQRTQKKVAVLYCCFAVKLVYVFEMNTRYLISPFCCLLEEH
jgi:hypothetical protein